MKRIIDLPDELAQSLDKYLQEHPEENFCTLVKEALENKLASAKAQPIWEETLERIEARRKKIHARTGGKPFKPSVTEIIHQMRDEHNVSPLSISE